MSGSLTISISGVPERFRSIEVHSVRVGQSVVQALARVLFHVQARDADALRPARAFDLDVAELGDRLVVLRNLVALGQVGIEVVLAREDRRLVDAAVQRHRRQHGELHRLPVQHRQRAGQAEAHRADVGVRRIAEVRGAAAEDLRLGQQLDVDFEPDDRLVLRTRRDRRFRGGGHEEIIAMSCQPSALSRQPSSSQFGGINSSRTSRVSPRAERSAVEGPAVRRPSHRL